MHCKERVLTLLPYKTSEDCLTAIRLEKKKEINFNNHQNKAQQSFSQD